MPEQSAAAAPAVEQLDGPTGESAHWVFVTSVDNFRRSADRQFRLQGVKARQRNKAARFRPGDRALYYLTGVKAFAGAIHIRGEAYEDHTPIRVGKKPGEDYPFRFDIAPDIVLLDSERWVPAQSLLDELAYPRKWPREHWTLAFQGNVHEWTAQDFSVVRTALEQAADR